MEYCGICSNNVIVDDNKMITDCNHTFCKSCLDNALKQRYDCPTCNTCIRLTKGAIYLYSILVHGNKGNKPQLILKKENIYIHYSETNKTTRLDPIGENKVDLIHNVKYPL
jgi:hypothetical protein